MDRITEIQKATAKWREWEGARRLAIVRAINDGVSQVDIAAAAGITQPRVAAIAKEMGLQRRKPGRPRRATQEQQA